MGEEAAWHGKMFECGSVLYTEGEAGSSMFVMVRGTLYLRGSNVPERILGCGDCFGVAEGLGVAPERQETAEARTSIHVLEVTLSALTRLLSLEKTSEEVLSHSERRPSKRSGVLKFPEEGHIFEQHARRLHIQLRKQQRRLKSRDLKTYEAQKPSEEEHPESATSQAGADAQQGHEKLERKDLKLPRSARIQRTGTGNLDKPMRRRAEEDSDVATPTALPPPAPLGAVSCKEHPRKWRLQVQKLQAELTEGNFQDGGKAREQFQQRLAASMRQDFFAGFQQPLDSRAGGVAEETGPDGKRASLLEDEDEEGEEAGATNGMLELSLLPSFADMSAKQKVGLMRHLQDQSKLAQSPRKGARLKDEAAWPWKSSPRRPSRTS